jgi:hypothetical protein
MARMMSAGEYDALTRLDFRVFSERVFKTLNPATPFLDNFHVGLITSKLEAVRTGKIRRLIINLPPRNLKSILCSVAFPAFLMARNPSVKIICASYGQDLASSLAADCRQILQESWYRSAFPKTQLVPDRQAVNAFETTAGGMRIATSVGGVLTGFGADTIVIDDPTKPEDALSEAERNRANRWFSNTVVTRLDDQNTGSIVVVMQRLHLDDFTGYLLSLSDWDVVSLPAIALEDEVHFIETPFGAYRHHRKTGEALHPARESLDVLAEIRRNQGTEHFAAQYLQSPMQPGGNMVKERWFSRYDLSCPPKFDRIVQSWDCAVKAKEFSDYSVCTTWGIQGERYFLLSVLREKLEYPDLKRAVIEQSGLFRATAVLVEDAAAGTQLIQELKRDGSFPVEAVTADKDKLTRLYGQTGMIEAAQSSELARRLFEGTDGLPQGQARRSGRFHQSISCSHDEAVKLRHLEEPVPARARRGAAWPAPDHPRPTPEPGNDAADHHGSQSAARARRQFPSNQRRMAQLSDRSRIL